MEDAKTDAVKVQRVNRDLMMTVGGRELCQRWMEDPDFLIL
jgi:hypothetical protein